MNTTLPEADTFETVSYTERAGLKRCTAVEKSTDRPDVFDDIKEKRPHTYIITHTEKQRAQQKEAAQLGL